MYVDGLLLLIIYVFSSCSILISLYTLWLLLEVEHKIHSSNKRGVGFNYTAQVKKKKQGHWG